MKCQNCGFETNQNYCPMCGTKVTVQQNVQSYNSFSLNNNVHSTQYNFQLPPIPPQEISAEHKKSDKKALTIVLSCLLTAVIIAGIAINIYSACVI